MKVQVIFAVKTMSSVYFHHSHIQTNLIAHFWLCTGIACACVCVCLCVCVWSKTVCATGSHLRNQRLIPIYGKSANWLLQPCWAILLGKATHQLRPLRKLAISSATNLYRKKMQGMQWIRYLMQCEMICEI